MADITKKVETMASKRPGLVAPADEPQLRGPRPVLNNRWGNALAKGGRSIGTGGKTN